MKQTDETAHGGGKPFKTERCQTAEAQTATDSEYETNTAAEKTEAPSRSVFIESRMER